MCGRVHLSSDYSEIKIRLKFAPNSVAPNSFIVPHIGKLPDDYETKALPIVNEQLERAGLRLATVLNAYLQQKLQHIQFNQQSKEWGDGP